MEKQPAVYILASSRHGTLYVGVTGTLVKRVYERKQHLIDGFTRRYGVVTLVYYELFEDMLTAIAREKQLKNWRREWKTELIERMNPDWRDLYLEIV